MVFSSPDFPANITLQPYQTLCSQRKFIWTQVYLNTSFCLVLHNTLWPVHQINHQINLNSPLPIPHWLEPLYLYFPHTWSLPHGSIFSNHIPISHTSQLTTHTTYNPSTYGVRMPSQHLKSTRIHSNTISKLIPWHHYDKETSAFRWDS